MPRKPTIYQKRARDGIIRLLETLPSTSPLPTLRELGEEFELHPSTISRLLRDLEMEGLIWKGSSGRFYAAGERSNLLRGAPICFIGREMARWSQLYHEVLAGISEVCAANESPLILHGSPTLVQVPVLLKPPIFSDVEQQTKELKKIAKNIPKGCAGVLLDHLWSEEALAAVTFRGGQRVQILFGKGKQETLIEPDYETGVEMALQHLKEGNFQEVFLVIPFENEPLIDHCIAKLRQALGSLSSGEVHFQDKERLIAIASSGNHRVCLVCPEDNSALGLADLIRRHEKPGAEGRIEILATQGTGVVTAPHSRLRYDYRRLGRAAVSSILHGTSRVAPMKDDTGGGGSLRQVS